MIAVTALCAILPGCHSPYVQTTISNSSAAPLNVLQVEYPSASFGVQRLGPGEAFHYRFKLLGSGPVKISFIDAENHEHATIGPWLNEGQEGPLDITVSQEGATFHATLRP